MSFYQHRKLEEQQIPFIHIVGYCLLGHLGMLCILFGIEAYSNSGYKVSFLGHKTLGAKVTVGSMHRKAYARPIVQEVYKEQTKVLEQVKENVKPAESDIKKVTPKKSVKEPLKKEENKVEEKVQSRPMFTELKRDYSSIKPKSKQAKRAKLESLDNVASKTVEVEHKPVVKEEPKKESIKKLEAKIDEIITAPEKKIEVPQVPIIEPLLSANEFITNTPNTEIITVDFSDTQIHDQFGADIRNEIYRHYKKPIGFDGNEAFTIKFIICNQKACSISPPGNEPLVLYAALKEAILKSTFYGIYAPITIDLAY